MSCSVPPLVPVSPKSQLYNRRLGGGRVVHQNNLNAIKAEDYRWQKAVFALVRHNNKLRKGPNKSNQGRVQLHRRVQKKWEFRLLYSHSAYTVVPWSEIESLQLAPVFGPKSDLISTEGKGAKFAVCCSSEYLGEHEKLHSCFKTCLWHRRENKNCLTSWGLPTHREL